MKGNAYMLKMSEKSEQTHEWDKQIKYTFQNEKKKHVIQDELRAKTVCVDLNH